MHIPDSEHFSDNCVCLLLPLAKASTPSSNTSIDRGAYLRILSLFIEWLTKMLAKAAFVGFLALLAAVEFGEPQSAVLLSVGELVRNAANISRCSPFHDVKGQF
jgi:hypothetical protein